MTDKKSISIIGPSERFLSGISYYTTYLSNALSKHYLINAVLFRHMLPKKLFPGSKRVGSNLSSVTYANEINKNECIDWYNPFSWHKAVNEIKESEACIFEWWTSSVAHMYFMIGCSLKHHKIPIILEFHEVVDTLEESILPIRVYSKFMGKRIRNLASAYVVHSHSDRQLVCARYHIPEEKVSIIPHGLYDQYAKYDKYQARKHLNIGEENVILFFGLLRPYKGAKYLVQAFEKLPNELRAKTLLLIAGEPWEDKDVIDAVANSLAKSNIRMMSEYISDEEIPYLFSAADTLTLPYTRASQSGVAHIGISYGMPIISSKVGGLAESLSKYEGTYFIPPQDVGALKDELVKVLCGDAKITVYSVPEELQWRGVADKWEELIESVGNSKIDK